MVGYRIGLLNRYLQNSSVNQYQGSATEKQESKLSTSAYDIPDVGSLDADALKAAVARRRSEGQMTRGSTPAMKVVSRTKELSIPPTKKWKYGFTVRGSLPVQVCL